MSYTDLLIIGAGPAGLMAAAWASQYEISTRIIDKNHARIAKGQADGLQSRTLEIFDSFGVADHVWKRGFHDIEICTWTSNDKGHIQRSQRVISQKVGIGRFTQVCINQGIIEQTFVDLLKINARVKVERSVVPEKLELDHSCIDEQDAYPITIKVRHSRHGTDASETNGVKDTTYHTQNGLEEAADGISGQEDVENGQVEIIKAKYVLGCDGAHSWTRQQLGLRLEGKQTDHIWGVMDIIPLTNFRKFLTYWQGNEVDESSSRYTSSIILNVPREDRLNRLYIQLSDEGSSYDRTQITPRTMLEAAQRIMTPYKLDYKYCDWWSLYQIGQRIAPKFSVEDRIFLAGDAVHTHSPKLGQGMNVSMQDTYNLCWKLGAVIDGSAQRSILGTYNAERRQVALDLMAADREISRFYSRNLGKGITSADVDGKGGVDFGAMRERLHGFLAGVGVTYGDSILVAKSNAGISPISNSSGYSDLIARQDLALNIKLGARFPSYKVINQAEARLIQLADALKSDGRWRILVFAGDLRDPSQSQRIKRLGNKLAAPESFLYRYTPSDRPIDFVIEVLTIHSSPRIEVELLDLPDIFHPWDEQLGWDYWKVFADDVSHHHGFDNAYVKWSIDRKEGCLIVCRPDQHVGYIGSLEDVDEVE
ncbi:MAG: hypothetical protein Q9187_005862, partial [Circinaria calcarea]